MVLLNLSRFASFGVVLVICGVLVKNVDGLIESRLLGSIEATPNAFPFTVVYLVGGKTLCGGALISSNYILTAASCLDRQTAVFVIIGAHDRMTTESNQYRELIRNEQFVLHEKYESDTFQNNIALMMLSNEIIPNVAIQNISLPSYEFRGEPLPDTNVIATGWGVTADGSSFERRLRYMNTTILQIQICNHYYRSLSHLDTLCIDGSLGQSGCTGDVGGPLVLVPKNEDTNRFTVNWLLVGIQSFVPPVGCNERWPTVYTRTASYLKWIEEKTGIVLNR